MFNSCARADTLATVLRETLQLRAMFRSLNPRLFSLKISRYLVIMVTPIDRTGGAKCSGILTLEHALFIM